MAAKKYSVKFEVVKKYYNSFKEDGTRMWSIEMVKNAVIKKWITKTEFEEITSEPYEV